MVPNPEHIFPNGPTWQGHVRNGPKTHQQKSNFSKINDGNERLIKHPDHPGWLWDNVENKWVIDPDNPPNGGVIDG